MCLFISFIFRGSGSGNTSSFSDIQNGHSYIFFMYACSFILSTILMNVSMSPKYKSAWIYYAAPVGQPGKVLAGMYKAIITLYFFPYFLVVSCAIVAIWGTDAINDIIFAFLACTVYGMLMALFMVKGLPFSKPVIIKQGGGRFIISLVILIFVAGVGFAHYFIMKWEN